MKGMRHTILFSFLFLSSISGFGQEGKRLFGGNTINIRVLFLSPYYEFGNDQINHFGFSGGFSIYKRLFIGGYKQWGNWDSPQEGNDFESTYRHGGLLIGHFTPIKKTKFAIIPTCYFGKGESKSKQSTPVSFTDAQIKFNVLTPELGISYRFHPLISLKVSTGYHFYFRTDEDEPPLGFNGFELNQNFARVVLRLGV